MATSDHDFDVIEKMNGAFDKALDDLREQHVKEIQDLRNLYIEAKNQIAELEAEIKRLKGIDDA